MNRTWVSFVGAAAVAVLALLSPGCGNSAAMPTACEKTCDCTQTEAPVRCPGEWICNAQKTCEYKCQSACSGDVYTCPDGTDCNGTFCSERKVTPCS